MCPSSALTPEERKRAVWRAQIEVQYGGKYDWGDNDLKKQFPDSWQIKRREFGASGDCSGKMEVIFRWLGKFVGRCKAIDMAYQKHGWKGKYVRYHKALKGTLAFFSFKSEDDHTGMFEEDTHDGKNILDHASFEKGKFISSKISDSPNDPFFGPLDCMLDID